MTFLEKILYAFGEFEERNAFFINGQYYTYKELLAIVAGFTIFIEDNCKDEERLGVLATDEIETYALILAIMLSGKTYIPIHPHHPDDRTGQIIQQSGIRFIFATEIKKSYNGTTIVCYSEISKAGPHAKLNFHDFSHETFAYILFTSGSTGKPKGVPVSYHNLNSFIKAFDALGYVIDESDRFLQMFDLTFDLSVMSYLVPLCIGACVYTIPETGMKFGQVYQVLEEHKITFALMVPSIISYLKPYFSEIHLPDLRYSLFCGEALYQALVAQWAVCVPGAVIENVYGPTEATIFCLTYRLEHPQNTEDYNGIVSIGRPMPGMEAIAVNEANEEVSDGEKGELCLYGEQLTPGYLDDDKNKESFFILNSKKFYRTGDIVFKSDKNNIMYCGRADHQVKIQGFRVELSEIEFHLRNISGNANVVAIVKSSLNGINKVIAVFEEERKDLNELLDAMAKKVPSYMLPSGFHFVSPFPLNANGKTDRKKLSEMINLAL